MLFQCFSVNSGKVKAMDTLHLPIRGFHVHATSEFLSKKLKHWTLFTYPCRGVYVHAISAFLSKRLKHWTLFTYPCGGVCVHTISAFLSKKLKLFTYPCGGVQWLSLAGCQHKVPLGRFCQSVTTFFDVYNPCVHTVTTLQWDASTNCEKCVTNSNSF